MSRIAEALAKAKERAGPTTAPFMANTNATDAEKQLARARRHQRFWVTLLSLAAIGASVLIWQRLDNPSAESAPAAPAASSQASTPVPVALPSAPQAVDGAPDPATARIVQALAITAVQTGERPRLLLQGRLVGLGETVAPGLIFSGLRDHHVLITDTRGAVYERKY
ncbi:MAG: hypothetical protein MUE42_08405 [Opitutaceae bacterium]|jgi:hypothetical protein|nr:hypothetical protein [Opitutaceae bacterium]